MVKKKTPVKKPISKATPSKKSFHNYEITKAKTIEDCLEIATVDCYGEYEEASGWLTCLEEVFEDMREVEFMGEVVEFKKFDFQGETAITGVVKKNGKTAKVSLESLNWIKPSPLQSLWHKAFLKYQCH